MLTVGSTICKRYKIVRLLGSGGMGSVAEAEDTVLANRCAIKEIGDSALQYAGGVENFKREAITLQSLKHDRIVGYRGFEQVKNTFYLITELVEGKSLEGLRQSGKLWSEPEAIEITLQVLDGLAYAHSKGVIHRDIKPANIMLDSTGKVTIVDFGIAKSGGASGATLFQAKGAYTPYYASPEQASLGVTSPQSDLYSVGVTLYEMLTGKVAQVFPADSSVRFNHDNVRALPGVHPAMAQVILTVVSVNEKLRYASAVEMADALRAIQGSSSGYTPPPTPAQPAPPPGPGTSVTPTPDQTTIFDIRRKK